MTDPAPHLAALDALAADARRLAAGAEAARDAIAAAWPPPPPPPVEPPPTVPPEPVDRRAPPGFVIPADHDGTPGAGLPMPLDYARIERSLQDRWDGGSAVGRGGRFMWLRESAGGGKVELRGAGATADNPAVFVIPENAAFQGGEMVLGEHVLVYGRVAPRTLVTAAGGGARVVGLAIPETRERDGLVRLARGGSLLLQYVTLERTSRIAELTRDGGRGLALSRCLIDRPVKLPGMEGGCLYVGASIEDELVDLGFWMDECLIVNSEWDSDIVEAKSSNDKVTHCTFRSINRIRNDLKKRHGHDAHYRLNYFQGPGSIGVRGVGTEILENAGDALTIFVRDGNMEATGGRHEDGGGTNWQSTRGAVVAGNAAADIRRTGVASGRVVPVRDILIPTRGPSRNARVNDNLLRHGGVVTDREVPGVDLAAAEALSLRQRDVGHAAWMSLVRGL